MYDKFVADKPEAFPREKNERTPNQTQRGLVEGLTPSKIYSLVNQNHGFQDSEDLLYNSNVSEDPRMLIAREGPKVLRDNQEPEEYIFVPQSNEKYPKKYRASQDTIPARFDTEELNQGNQDQVAADIRNFVYFNRKFYAGPNWKPDQNNQKV